MRVIGTKGEIEGRSETESSSESFTEIEGKCAGQIVNDSHHFMD